MAHVLGDPLGTCCAPLSGANPYGDDVKYDSTFLDLRTEVQKLTALSSTEGGVDWKSVKAWSLQILTASSKDLTVAAYLTVALFIRDGYRGMSDGLVIMDTFLRDHWEGIFPPLKKMRSRVMVVEWLETRLAPLVEEREPATDEAAVLPELRDQVMRLKEIVSERFEHLAPSLGDLLAAISQHAAAAAETPEPATEPEPTPAPPTQETAPAAQPPAPAPAPSTSPPATPAPQPAPQPAPKPPPAAAPPSADTSTSDLKSHILALVNPLRSADPKSPIPYRLLRCLRWDELSGPPPADPSSGKTRIPPPRVQQRAALDGLCEAGSWPALLDASEGAFQAGSGTFWLDLQRYTFTALTNLGATAAAEVVKQELCTLLERYGGLPGYTFADDSPFAGENTRAWLEQLTAPAEEQLVLAAPPQRAAGDEAVALSQEAATQALQLFTNKKPTAAFAILQQAIDGAGTPPSRFQARLAAARVCLQSNQIAWARTLLEHLTREMDGFVFESWERELAAEALYLLGMCYSRLAKNRKTEDRDAVRQALEQTRARLFRLDMRAAAALEE